MVGTLGKTAAQVQPGIVSPRKVALTGAQPNLLEGPGMRKLDVIMVFCVVALGVAGIQWMRNTGGSSDHPMLTKSGRWKVLPCPYKVAGLTMGMMKTDEAVKVLGQPRVQRQRQGDLSMDVYSTSDGLISLAWREDRLITVMINGANVTLEKAGRPIPAQGASQAEVLEALGLPSKKSTRLAEFEAEDGTMIYHFENERAASFECRAKVVETAPRSQ